jgi:hypothetical protein
VFGLSSSKPRGSPAIICHRHQFITIRKVGKQERIDSHEGDKGHNVLRLNDFFASRSDLCASSSKG